MKYNSINYCSILFQNEINKGVDILICTPKILLELLKQKETKLIRIIHFVIEQADELFEKFPGEMELILQKINQSAQNYLYTTPMQLIVASNTWTKSLEKLIKRLNDFPTICIGAFIEAALYGRSDIEVKFLQSTSKKRAIEDIVVENYKFNKTVILCNNKEEIDDLCEFLEKYQPIRIDDDTSIDEQQKADNCWNTQMKGNYPLIIGTNVLLKSSVNFNITDAVNIIQYSIPDTVYDFGKRFQLFIDNIIGPFSNEQPIKTKMYIFVDENCTLQFCGIIELLKRLNAKLTPKLIQIYTGLLMQKENDKVESKTPICKKIKIFGTCLQIARCKQRHTFSEKDISKTIPNSGIIVFKILHMYDISSYACRLIKYYDSENNLNNIDDKYAEISLRISKLSNEKHRTPLYKIKIGEICAVEESPLLFRRCKVVEITSRVTLDIPDEIKVLLIDTGATISTKLSCLFELPDKELVTIPPVAVDIYIADIGPPDKDTDWSDTSRIRFQQKLKDAEYEKPNCYFSARIKLQLGNTIWVNNMILREYSNGLQIHKLSAIQTMFKYNFAEERPGHLDKLYQLCEESGKIYYINILIF